MQSPTSHHGSEKEHIGSDYFLTFLPLSLRLSWAGAWVTGGRDVCPLLGVGGRSCIGSAATSGLRALLRRRGLNYYGRADACLGFFDFFIVILLFCCCLCCFCDIFIVIQSYSVFIVIQQYIWAASAAATPARPELLWESRRPSQCRLSYFSPDQRRHDTFGTDFVSYFSQPRLQPSQLGCREFFLREFFSSRSLQTSHQCLLEALPSDGSQIFRILSSRCSVWNFIR